MKFNFDSMTREEISATIAQAKAIKARQTALLECFEESRANTNKPSETVSLLVARLGYDSAVLAVAELVRTVGDWDERVRPINRDWADSVDGTVSREWMRDADIFQPSAIHPANIDNLADAMRKFTPTDPEEDPETVTVADGLAIVEEAKETITAKPGRSAWDRGVTAYALELLDGLAEDIEGGYFSPDDLAAPKLVDRALLNGASDWREYSSGGCSLIYDGDIAERLCTPSELKRTKNGQRNPNGRESWIDVQARALYQASAKVEEAIKKAVSR